MKKLNKILLVDDDDINNYLNTRILNKLDICEKISVCKNGDEALGYIEDTCNPKTNECPDFIILDFVMPVMDGKEFMEELHKLNFEYRKKMVVLLLGANLSNEVIQEFLNLGVQEYTSKPLDEETVMDTYHKYWGEKGLLIG